MRRAPTPAITSKMYRHFATMTVAITALLALFANGDKQPAVAAESVVSEPHQALAKKPAKSDTRELADGDSGTWGSDEDGDFGRPMVNAAGAGSSWFSNPFGSSNDGRAPLPSPLDPRDTADRTDDDSGKVAASGPSAEQVAAAVDASRLRSGAAGRD